jgi:hypothetical protein
MSIAKSHVSVQRVRLSRFGGFDRLNRKELNRKFYGFNRWNSVGMIIADRLASFERRFGKKVVEKDVAVVAKKKLKKFDMAPWPNAKVPDKFRY